MPAFVILSEAKNLMDSGTYTSEILRLTPQNDVVGQPQRGGYDQLKEMGRQGGRWNWDPSSSDRAGLCRG